VRIESPANFPGDRLQKQPVDAKSTDSFANLVKKTQSNLHSESLNQLMNQVDLQGQRLSNQRTLENLRDYKNSVKKFIGESLNYGLQLSEKQSFQPGGGNKTHQLIEVIDQRLLDMNDEVLDKEKSGIDTLRMVGEIKGLLVNLYM
jgi:uncharacterized protein